MNFLRRLFGHKEAAPELPPEFLQAAPPDWLIELKGQDAESGGHYSLRVQISVTMRKGAADILTLPAQPEGEPRSATVDLERTEIDRLLVILGFSFPNDFAGMDAKADDEPPMTLAINRREPYAATTAQCALGGWLDSRKPGPPVVEIGRVLLELKKRTL